MCLCNYKYQDKIKDQTSHIAYKMAHTTLQKELYLPKCMIIVFNDFKLFSH